MNIHETYLRKQAVAVEGVWGKGFAKDLLAAADEIKRLEQEVVMVVALAHRHGWNGVTNSKVLATFLEDLLDTADRTEERDAELRAELDQLRDCEEIKLVAFLSRPDVVVERNDGNAVVSFTSDRVLAWMAENIIDAARMAMKSEES